MSNKNARTRRKESTSQTGANSPRGKRPLLAYAFRQIAGASAPEGSPPIGTGTREGGDKSLPLSRMFRHIGERIGRASAVAGFRLQRIIPSHTTDVCVCV